ncbi:MAG TPA: HDOD domain-containing protein [Pirellulales bacterium]|jgi:HD-like signal output (HDOD) protein|nr:HDOD domain-containing protein [Pirellulales bacterium]
MPINPNPNPVMDLDRILRTAQLPALPQSAIKLLELSRDPENGPTEFASPIEADPGLAGQILKFVNSSYFGFSHEISSVKMAITLVGIRTIKNFSLWSAVFSLMPNPKCGPFDLKNLWQDSLRRALFARAMGKLLGLKEAEETFSAALLQDMAVPLLAKELPKEYLSLLDARHDGQVRLSDLEKERFGWNHAEAAAKMARSWKMPEGFAHLLERHIAIEPIAPGRPMDAAQFAVSLSSLLPSVSDSKWSECGRFDETYGRLCPAGGPSVTDMLARIDREFKEFAPVLKLSTPTKSLAAWYEESLAPAA